MINKLPRWILAGGWLLAFVAGMTNVVAILSFAHQTVSHLTATASHLAIAAVELDGVTLRGTFGVIGSFFAGAVLSGWLIRSAALELGRRYGTALLIESVALCVAAAAMQYEWPIGIALCCFACGLQNGLASSFSGAIVRTTHMTGLFTDLGVCLGHILHGRPADRWRLTLYGSIITGYIAGGAAATLVFPVAGSAALLLPAGIVAMIAVAYQVRSKH